MAEPGRLERRGLADRLVLITGAAGGLGAALAERAARAGARLALLDVDGEALERRAAALPARRPPLTAACDVADAAACARALERVQAQAGDVDLLVNNAGITHRSAFAATELAVLRRVIEVNLIGALNCTRLAIAGLIRRRGRIAVISSMAGLGPLQGRTAYAASKHGLHGLFDSLRSELRADGVSVTLVCPTFVATGIAAAALGADGRPAPQPQATVGRVATADETAAVVLRASLQRRALVLPSATGRLACWVNKLMPRLYERLMARAVRAELEG